MSEVLGVEFEAPTGESLRFEWDAERLAELQPDPAGEPVWQLTGELDWDEVERVRVVSARLDDGRLLAIAALTPAGSENHGQELIAGAIGDHQGFARLDQALVSTEYGADGLPRRIGLELSGSADALAMRITGQVAAIASDEAGGVKRTSASLALAGTAAGSGALDLLQRA